MSPKTIDYNNAISQSIKINSSKIGTTAKSDIAGAVFKSQVATNDIPTQIASPITTMKITTMIKI